MVELKFAVHDDAAPKRRRILFRGSDGKGGDVIPGQPARAEPGIHRATNYAEKWIPGALVALAPRNDDGETFLIQFSNNMRICIRIPAAPCARVVHASLAEQGRRECRAANAPAASRAKKQKAHEHSHHRSTGFTRHSPREWF
jgi:hypothetical protein